MSHFDDSWIDNALRGFLGPSIAVKANLQTLFTNKHQELPIIPEGKLDHLSIFTLIYP